MRALPIHTVSLPLTNPPNTRRLIALVALLALVTSVSACAAPGSPAQTLSGHITVDGSTALQPLAMKAATLFTQQHPQVKIDVTGGGSATGLADVNAGKVAIGDSDIYADPALYPDPDLTDHLVCLIPFTMIVNPAIHVTSLTRDQIIAIFSTGEIHNWMDVGGPDAPIVPVVRPKTSGTCAIFRKYVLGGRDEKGTLLQSDSSQTVLQTVAQTPGAIGYLAVSVLDSTVRQVAIDKNLPTAVNIQSGKYAFWGFEHMYTLGDDDPRVEAFLNFMTSSQVQLVAAQLGYIPIASAQLTKAAPSGNSNVTAEMRRKDQGADGQV